METRTRVSAGALLVLVFGAGAALGLALDLGEEPVAEPVAGPSASTSLRPAAPPSEWVIDRMELSAEQRARVDSVVDHYAVRMSEFQAEYRPQFHAIVDSTDRAILAILSREQAVRYDSLSAAAASWRARNGRGHRRN